MFKKVLRGLIKIPATPFVTAFLLFALLVMYVVMFFDWLYDADEWDKFFTKSMKQDLLNYLKKWYTTV